MILTVPEQMMFSTIRVVTNQGQSHGTGFVYRHENREYLVTNRHVVQGTTEGELTLTGLNHSTGSGPRIGPDAIVPVQDEAWRWHYHPSGEIDIAVMLLGPISKHASEGGHPPYYIGITERELAGREALQQIDVMEEVVFVGYPERVYDERNNLPVVRRGTTASLPWVDYNGRPEFLIDASVFPGSSGSPVFAYNRPPWLTKYGQLKSEERLLFLGVLTAAGYRNNVGVIIPDSDQSPRQSVVAKEMIDLGVVLKADCVLETVRNAQ